MKSNIKLTATAFGLLTFTAARPLEKDETSTLPGFVGSSILVPVEELVTFQRQLNEVVAVTAMLTGYF